MKPIPKNRPVKNANTSFSLKFFVRLVAIVVIVAGVGIAGYAAFNSSDKVDTKQVFADRTMLAGLWNSYKTEYWEASTGRTLDKQSNNITTSEGQSYTMLRSVWQSDKTTFDSAWAWTQSHLQRQDKLFSWRWGQMADGTYGILTDQGGQNTASDADSDIALALIMAASKWQQSSYLNDAKAIITSIWEKEVVTINGKPYYAANDLEKASTKGYVIVNPSYLSPYEYRVFAKLDKTAGHDWNALVDSSYALLNTAIDATLDAPSSAKLVPDWVTVSTKDGSVSAPTANEPNYKTTYGYEAFRSPWRLALDYQWNNADAAKATLAKMSYLSDQWNASSKLAPVYTHSGEATENDEKAGAYGGDIGYFIVTNPAQATQIYNKKLKYLYDPNKNSFNQDLSYYDSNWAWFGMALYTGQLDNLTESITD